MELATRSLADAIFDDLRASILRGELLPGDRLPGERDLAARYDTNRNTLREAIRKLEQARLVSVRHGHGVRVLDWRRTAAIDVLQPFLEHASDMGERIQVLCDLLMMRARVLELAVAMAADRAGPADQEALDAIAAAQCAAFRRGDRTALARGDVRWLSALIDAAHSLGIRWVANTLIETYARLIERFPGFWVMEPGYPDYLRKTTEAIARGDAQAAMEATRTYFLDHDSRLNNVIELLRATSSPPGEVTDAD